MSQVHKETLTAVDNAIPSRKGLDLEIFGMEGVPEDVRAAHDQRILTNFYQAESERRAATGNSSPATGSGGGGSGSGGGGHKKPKLESAGDIKKRLAEHKARLAEQAAARSESVTPSHIASPYVSASSLLVMVVVDFTSRMEVYNILVNRLLMERQPIRTHRNNTDNRALRISNPSHIPKPPTILLPTSTRRHPYSRSSPPRLSRRARRKLTRPLR